MSSSTSTSTTASSASSSHTCARCNELITGTTIVANGKYYHQDHFLCDGSCGKNLKDTLFHPKEDKNYCESCFIEKFCPTCAYCGKGIIGVSIKIKFKFHVIKDSKKTHFIFFFLL